MYAPDAATLAAAACSFGDHALCRAVLRTYRQVHELEGDVTDCPVELLVCHESRNRGKAKAGWNVGAKYVGEVTKDDGKERQHDCGSIQTRQGSSTSNCSQPWTGQ